MSKYNNIGEKDSQGLTMAGSLINQGLQGESLPANLSKMVRVEGGDRPTVRKTVVSRIVEMTILVHFRPFWYGI